MIVSSFDVGISKVTSPAIVTSPVTVRSAVAAVVPTVKPPFVRICPLNTASVAFKSLGMSDPGDGGL
jgi:hypothetical protein